MATAPRVAASPPVPPDAGLALVVEDDPATRLIETDVLEDAGYDVMASASGEDALAAARRRRPDVVLLDLALPRMSGFDVLHALRGDPRTRAVPVVLVSAYTDMVRDCRERGATGCLRKPFDLDQLLEEVDQAQTGGLRATPA